MAQRVLPVYFFFLESIFLYFLLFMFYARTAQLPPLSALTAVIVIGFFSLMVLLKGKGYSKYPVFLASVLGGGTAYFLGLSPMSALLCSLFLLTRLKAFLKDPALWLEERSKLAVSFYGAGFVIFFFSWVFNYPFMNWLFGVVILFTVFFGVGRFLQHVKIRKDLSGLLGVAASIGVIGILASIVTIVLPFLKNFLFYILKGLLYVVGILLSPLFNLAEGKQLELKVIHGGEDSLPTQEGQKKSLLADHYISHVPLWVWLTIVAIVLVAVWILRKRVNNAAMAESLTPQNNVKIIRGRAMDGHRKSRGFRVNAPQDYLRKLIFQFQIYAEKHHVGRYRHETLREWFERSGFSSNEQLFTAYDQVRYGQATFSKNELKEYEAYLGNLKDWIKEQTKDNKKSASALGSSDKRWRDWQ